MPRIEVEPDLLSGGAARQAALAVRLREMSSHLRSATASAAAAAGDAGAAGAMDSCGQAWSSALDNLAASVSSLGGNLGAAAGAYTGTDQAVIPITGAR